jgi:hypothetical protein
VALFAKNQNRYGTFRRMIVFDKPVLDVKSTITALDPVRGQGVSWLKKRE